MKRQPTGQTNRPARFLLATLALTALPILLVTSRAQLAPDAKVPQIKFEQTVYDFGEVKSGDVIRYDFKVSNEGSGPLEILEVRPSCGCTTAGEWPRNLEPGASGIIPIELKTERFRGSISKTIRIRSNDPKTADSVLQIKGKIWTPIQITPEYASFPRLGSRDEIATKIIKITNHTDDPLAISELKTTNPKFAPTLKEIEKGKNYELHVKTVPPLQYGLNRAYISFKTSHPDMPTVSVTTHANVAKPVEATPSYLTMPIGKLDRDQKKYVTVINNSGEALKFDDVAFDSKDVKIDFQELKEGKYYRFTLTFPKGWEVDEKTKANFSFKTSHKEFSEIKIPIKPYQQPSRPVVRSNS